MPSYATFSDLERTLIDHKEKNGKRLQFTEAIQSLCEQGKLLEAPTPQPSHARMIDHSSMEAFEAIANKINFPVAPTSAMTERVLEPMMFPVSNDVFIIRHPRYTRPFLHRHDYVEMNCVIDGSCILHFEDKVCKLHRGALVVIAPQSLHDIEITDHSTVYCIMLRRSTFQACFFSLLSREDALAMFFRRILKREVQPNYLLFQEEEIEEVRLIVQNAMLESFRMDSYSNSCCINYVNLLLAHFLRGNKLEHQYDHERASGDFSRVLHVIRSEYRTITLDELANRFHYSKPHLCNLIKQNVGTNFTDLVKQIRIGRAVEYLLHTNYRVSEIAETVGYHSADHFSRVFRNTYGCSPQEFRHRNASPEDSLIPFEMK